MKKLVALVLTLTIFALCGVAAFAAGSGIIEVTTPTGTTDTDKNTYTLYKVFDAITDGTGSYSYKKISGKTTALPAGFVEDDGGNIYFADIVDTAGTDTFKVMINGSETILKNKTTLDSTDISNIWNYVKNDSPVGSEAITGPGKVTFDGLDDGYYYVASTTGALVIIDSTRPKVEIVDKNEVPPMDKKITGASTIDADGKNAIAQVGTNVEYTLTITKKKGAENYILYDNLGAGLKYNKDAKVYIGTEEQTNTTGSTKYTKTTETDSALVVSFDNDWMAGLDDETVVKVVYTALVTEDALQTDPANNTAHLEYGHTPGENKTPTKTTHTYNAKFSVIKKDGKGEFLAGAGFVLKNNNKYYKYTAATSVAPEKVEWVDNIDDATEYTSNATDGKLSGEFTGLADGTYTLVEKTVPSGYNKTADYTFTVKGADVAGGLEAENLIQSSEVINNQGSELPSTGGIGTTIFYAVGGLMVLGAAIIMVSRRKAEAR